MQTQKWLKGKKVNSLSDLFDHIEWESNKVFIDNNLSDLVDFRPLTIGYISLLIAEDRIYKAENKLGLDAA